MKVTNDTLLTMLVSLSTATLTGAGTLIWWVSGLGNKVKNNETGIIALKVRDEQKQDKIEKLDKSLAVSSTELKNIYDILKEIKEKLK